MFVKQLPHQVCCLLIWVGVCAATSQCAISEEITPADRDWWAFRPLHKPGVPEVENDDWSINAIDRFVYRRLSQRAMRAAPRADKATLVRRLYYDLIGLPPTPEETAEFLNDESPDAWGKLVDRLLGDRRYGEHWARFWLDVVRYAESDGWNKDSYRPHIWQYRDYVVRSFNTDKAYPEFVREQLAGDELPGEVPEHLMATGFLRLGIYEYNQRDARSHWNDILNEITDVTGDVFLGVGMACARCHDHKFDPLPQKDYYRLRAFFEPIVWRDDIPGATQAEKAAYQLQLAAWQDEAGEVLTQIDQLLDPYHNRKWKSTIAKFPLEIQACFHKPVADRSSWEHQMAYLVSRQFLEEGDGPLKNMEKEDKEQYEALQKQLAELGRSRPEPLPELMTATDFPGALSATVMPDDPERVAVQPGFLSVLSSLPADSEPTDTSAPPCSSGRRTALAVWIGRDDNPLTTRVIVNRIWQQHFAHGIVPSPNDFGHRGQPPTHPELLDWLTSTFVENGWSMKFLHRLILQSAVWQQSALHPRATEYQQLDPDESLLWRTRIRRLKAEQLRDAMLTASGELDDKIGGPSVEPEAPRRALYVKRFRNTPDPLLHAFDCAAGLKSVSQRDSTTTPIQALLMINGDYVLDRARKLAQRLQERGFDSPAELLQHAFRLTWGRGPTSEELASSLQFVQLSDERGQPAKGHDPLIDFCHVLFNSNEFLYVD